MSHTAAVWCSHRYTVSASRPLNHLEAQTLSSYLLDDAGGYGYSAAICIADACRAIESGFYSWATAKLYYSCFYSLRGLLALRGHGLFYVNEKPKLIQAIAGQFFRQPTKPESRGGTHGLVITMFGGQVPGHVLLSQPISGTRAPKWMKLRREEVNYGRARYFEPSIPKWMNQIDRVGIRRSLNAYILDNIFLYTFDEDHAILAFPIRAIKSLLSEMAKSNRELFDEDILYLAKKVADEAGPIVEWSRFLRITETSVIP